MKLSRCKARTLRRLAEEYKADQSRWFSAFDLSESIATMNALDRKGLVETKPGMEWFYKHKVTK